MPLRLARLIQRYPDLAPCREDLARAYTLLSATFHGGGKVLLCGNGGSAADCEHIVGELMKAFMRPRPLPQAVRSALRAAFPTDGDGLADRLQEALPALSLVSQSALLTATANDIAAETIFAQQVYAYGTPGDLLWGISTSGTSRNVVQAMQVARVRGLHTVGLTGRSGGALLGLCDVTVCVPYDRVDEVQERHLPIYHELCAALEDEFFGASLSGDG